MKSPDVSQTELLLKSCFGPKTRSLNMVSVKHCCYGTCNSDTRYADKPHMRGVWFLPFPKPITQGEKCDRWIKLCGRVAFDRTNVRKCTYICSKHFVGGNGPTTEHPDPIPASAVPVQRFPTDRIASKTRRPQSRCPKSKQRKTLKHTTSAGTQNENITEHHSQQQETSGAAGQTSTPGPAGQYSDSDHVYSTNIGYERRKVSAPAVKLKRSQRVASRRRLQPKRDQEHSDTSVLRLSDMRPLGFGTNGATISPQDVRKLFVKQMFVIKKDPPEPQDRSLRLDQEEQKPPQIKEEIEEVDITRFILNPYPLKREDEEEKPQISELHHSGNIESLGSDLKPEFLPVEIKEESFGDRSKEDQKPTQIKEDQKPTQIKEDQKQGEIVEFIFSPVFVKSEGEEETRQPSELHHNWCNETTDTALSGPDQYLEDKTLDSSETDISDGNWEESNEPQSDLFSVEINEVSVGDKSPNRSVKKPFSCSVCFQCFKYGKILISHKDIHDSLAFRCNVCNEGFGQKSLFVKHMEIHTEDSLFSFSYN